MKFWPEKARFVRNEKFYSKKRNGKWYILKLDQTEVRELNETSGELWELLQSPRTIDELVTSICAIYDVPKERAENDIQAFLPSYIKEGFVKKL